MKRFFLLSILMVMFTISANAQLEVNPDGNVRIGDFSSYGGFKINLLSGSSVASPNVGNVGIIGRSIVTGNNPVASCGVYGLASNSYCGMCYGVAGTILNNSNGAAVIGGVNNDIVGYPLYGKYAGYFLGNFDVVGSVTAPSIIQPSDLQLSDNITSISSRGGSALNKLLDMNVVEYTRKPLIPSLKLPDSVSVEKVLQNANVDIDKKHFGLIAQELQTIYPELVVKGQDGYLGVNYIELVPILIRSIQELSQKVENLEKASDGQSFRAPAVSDIGSVATSKNILYQNNPNPFKEATTIRFSLEDGIKSAYICIFDMTGKMLKKISIPDGDTSVKISGGELGEGMFFYSLIVNGREIDTKRMIITK